MGGREDNTTAFHQISLLLHTANTALVIVLMYLIFGQAWAAALSGLLFGLHPMTVETIAWVSERKTVLAAFFAFSCLIFYVLFTKKGSWLFYAGSFALYILAMMSKPTSIPIPLIMLLMDYWPLRRLDRRKILEKAPLLAAGGLFAVITYLSQKNTLAVITPQEYGAAQVLLVFCHNIIFYLSKIAWPVNLSSHYAFPEPIILLDPAMTAGIIGTAILIPLLLVSLRWTRALAISFSVFFIAILPTMQIVGFTNVIASDKFAYLPSVGILMLLTSFLVRLCCGDKEHKPLVSWKVAAVVALIAASLEAAATRQYLTDWKDTTSLYLHMLKVRPNAVTLNYNFGNMLLEQGKLDEAIGYLRRAYKVRPNDIDINNSLGVALLRKSNWADATVCFQKAVAAKNDDIKSYRNLANALRMSGRQDEAISRYRRVLEAEPNDVISISGIGLALVEKKEPNEALEYFYKALQIDPNVALTYYRIAGVLRTQGKLNEAAEYYRRTLQKMPNQLDSLYQLSRILTAKSPTIARDAEEAAVLAERAATITGYKDPVILQILARAYAAGGQFDKAIETAENALSLTQTGKNEKLAESIRQQLESYKAKKNTQ